MIVDPATNYLNAPLPGCGPAGAALRDELANTTTCEWFAYCGLPALGTIDHPTLGNVPCCGRCAALGGHDLVLYPMTDQDAAPATLSDVDDGAYDDVAETGQN